MKHVTQFLIRTTLTCCVIFGAGGVATRHGWAALASGLCMIAGVMALHAWDRSAGYAVGYSAALTDLDLPISERVGQ